MFDHECLQLDRKAMMRTVRELRDIIRIAVPTVIEYQAVGAALPRWIEDLPARVWVAICLRVHAHDRSAGFVQSADACVR